jgi:hypothetical protein
MRRELAEPWTLDADFYGPTQDVNLPYELITRHASRNEHPIIRSIKSIRKKN